GLLRALVEVREPAPVDLLEPGHRAGELALREALAAFEPDAPAERGVRVERHEVREVVVRRAGAVRERAAGVDERRVEGEGGQQGWGGYMGFTRVAIRDSLTPPARGPQARPSAPRASRARARGARRA